jgi:hypothetical protein
MRHSEKEAMNYEETILVSLDLSSSWQSIRPSYPKISIFITELDHFYVGRNMEKH